VKKVPDKEPLNRVCVIIYTVFKMPFFHHYALVCLSLCLSISWSHLGQLRVQRQGLLGVQRLGFLAYHQPTDIWLLSSQLQIFVVFDLDVLFAAVYIT